jgi:hypothetical protein
LAYHSSPPRAVYQPIADCQQCLVLAWAGKLEWMARRLKPWAEWPGPAAAGAPATKPACAG